MYIFLLLLIHNQINFYIVSRAACQEPNKFFICFAVLDFCQNCKTDIFDIFTLHPSSYKKFYQFCTVSRIAFLELIVVL